MTNQTSGGRLLRPAILALTLTLSISSYAHAQAPAMSDAAVAGDTSWFAEYHPAPRDTLAPAAYEGWKLFETNCSRCHGQEAEGSSFAPSLVQALGVGGPVRTQAEFLQIACNGVPGTGMPTWCSLGLTKDTLQIIYSYLHGRAQGTIHPGHPALRESSTGASE